MKQEAAHTNQLKIVLAYKRTNKTCEESRSPSPLPWEGIIKVGFIFFFALLRGGYVKEETRLSNGSLFCHCPRRGLAGSHAIDELQSRSGRGLG